MGVRGAPHSTGLVGLSKAEPGRSIRRLAEIALQDSESKWRSFAENVPDLIMTIDRAGTIQFVNHPTMESFRMLSSELRRKVS